MAVTQSGTSVVDGGNSPIRTRGTRRVRIGRWIAVGAGFVATVALVLGLLAKHYQPLGLWNLIGGFPGMHQPAHARSVNDFGGQIGELYIPHRDQTFAASVSLFNSGSFAVTIEAVSRAPPHPGYPWALSPAGPVLHWTENMVPGPPDPGRPIAGTVLTPGDGRGMYVAVPVRPPRCYIPRAFQVLASFYVKERFGPFTKWVRIPLMQPLLVNAPAEPPNQPGQGIICAGR